MTTREQMISEFLRQAERESVVIEEPVIVLIPCAITALNSDPCVQAARERVYALELELADACPCG